MKIELYHDILARKVFEAASPNEQSRLQAERFVRERYEYFLKSGVLLGKNDLKFIDPFLEQNTLNEDELKFVETSRSRIAGQAAKKRNTAIGIIVVLAVSLAFALWQLVRARVAVADQKHINWALLASAALNDGDPSRAFRLAQKADNGRKNKAVADLTNSVLQQIIESQIQCDLVHADTVTAFDISDSLVITGTAAGEVIIWNLKGQKIKTLRHRNQVNVLKFSPDKPFFLSGSDDGTAFLVHLETWEIDTFVHSGGVQFVDFSFNHPFFLIGGGKEKSVRVFELSGAELKNLVTTLDREILHAEIAPFGNFFMAADSGRCVVKELNYKENPFAAEIKLSEPFKIIGFIQSDFLHDRSPFLFINTGDTTGIFDTNGRLEIHDPFYRTLNSIVLKDENSIRRITHSRDRGDYPQIAWISGESTIKKWTYGRVYENGAPVPFLDFISDSKEKPVFICFSGDNTLMLFVYSNGRADLRDARKGKLVRELKCLITDAKFSSDRKVFVSGNNSEIIRIWDLGAEKIAIENGFSFFDQKIRPLSEEEKNKYLY